jgi:hypothetical protein
MTRTSTIFRKTIGVCLLAALCVGGAAFAGGNVTTYTYAGNNFDTVSGSYTTAMSVSGSFSLASALPANMPSANISGSLVDYQFTDGVNVFNTTNSYVAGFFVSTDATGGPEFWAITLWPSPPPTLQGQMFEVVQTQRSNFARGQQVFEEDLGGTFTCGTAGNPCVSAVPTSTNNGSRLAAGVWTVAGAPNNAVPTLGTWGLLVMSLLLIAGSILMMRRQRSIFR